MSHRARIRKLEHRVRQAGYFHAGERCPTCGGPDPRADRIMLIDESRGESPCRCGSCGRPVDQDGHDLGRHGFEIVLVKS